MLDLENTIINNDALKLRCEVAGLRGRIEGMEWGIEYLKSELRRIQQERDELLLKLERKKKGGEI